MLHSLWKRSLEKAIKEQGLKKLADKLSEIVPKITEQYSTFKIDNPYLEVKARNMHAFQISLVNLIIEEFKNPVIVDIGDSAGTHLQYIIGLHAEKKNIKCLSVNLDAEAIKRIREKGINAIVARAENTDEYKINADIFLCYETLEHLMNPCQFLHELSIKTEAKYLIVTVPYLKRSRIGLHHIRLSVKGCVNAETTHIYELSPKDWRLLVKHSGWIIVHEKIYFQYPKRNILRFTKILWKRFDYEGFFGMILSRDNTWSSQYLDW